MAEIRAGMTAREKIVAVIALSVGLSLGDLLHRAYEAIPHKPPCPTMAAKP